MYYRSVNLFHYVVPAYMVLSIRIVKLHSLLTVLYLLMENCKLHRFIGTFFADFLGVL